MSNRGIHIGACLSTITIIIIIIILAILFFLIAVRSHFASRH